MKRAGVIFRIGAAAIDGVAALILVVIALVISRNESSTGIVFLVLWLLYSAMEVVFAGTPGKLLLGLRIARQNGQRAEPARLLLRWSTKYYCLLPAIFDCFFPGTIINIIGGYTNTIILCGLLGAFNDDRLTWHDEWAGTAVWKRQRDSLSAAVAAP